MKPTILLTGKTGQLGYELNRLLPGLGEVIAPDRKELDLLHPEATKLAIRKIKPQLIVNAAAYTAVDAAETDELKARAVNSEAPQLLAEEAKTLGAMLVHFSTDYVFDGAKKSPYTETDSSHPLNAYGRTKLSGEDAIRHSGVAHLIFRTSWVYATRGRNFLLAILRIATEREELRIVDDQIGAPTSAVDLAEATTTILFSMIGRARGSLTFPELTGTYHMTAAGQTNWYGFAKGILEEARRAPQDLSWLASATSGRPLLARRVLPISSEEFHSPTRRPAYSVLSNLRLKKAFGVTLPEWRTQLQRCFYPEQATVNPSAVLSSRYD